MTVKKNVCHLSVYPQELFSFFIYQANDSGGSFNLCNFAVEELLNCFKSIFYEAIANENINAVHGPI